MNVLRFMRRASALSAVGLLLFGGFVIGPGAELARALETHPCLPGETDYVGEVEFVGGGRAVWVTFCLDGNDPPTPSLPWGSPSVGHPCEAGETDGTHKVRGEIEDVGLVTIWFCSDAPGGPPLPPPADAPPPPPPPAPGEVPARPIVKGHDPIIADGPSLAFDPIGPARVFDTRPTGTPLAPGITTRVDLSGAVGAATLAVAVNVTAADPAAAGYLSAWNCAGGPPPTSTVNFAARITASSNTIVQLDATGGFCVTASAAVHVIVDINGRYSTAGAYGFEPVEPVRIHDSRPTPIAAGSTIRVALPPRASPMRAAFVNLTAVTPAASGYLTVWPCSLPQPEVSNLNFAGGISAVANAAQVPVDGTNELCIFNSSTSGLLVDLLGVYSGASDALRYQPTRPVRVLDTRDGTGGFIGTMGNNQSIYIFMPTGMKVVGTVTAVDPPQDGYLVVWDGPRTNRPPVSNLNAATTTVANMFMSGVGDYLWVGAGPTGGEHVLVDVTGTFVKPSS